MPRLHFGNFDVEHEWADPGYARRPAVARLNAELTSVFLGIADDGDTIWTPEPLERDFAAFATDSGLPAVTFTTARNAADSAAEFQPWGWSREAMDMAAALGAKCDSPSLEAVRAVNARSFSMQIEEGAGVAPEQQRTIRSGSQLDEAFAALPDADSPWVLKAEFGMSGRERHLGRGRPTNLGVHTWTRRRVERDGCVVFEPWLDVADEVGIQFTVIRNAPPTFEGIVENLVESNGQYRGSLFRTDDELEAEWAAAIEFGRGVADHVRTRGYFGPLGIDACRYRIGDDVRLRPLQDLNARMTMGRLALGFRDRFGEDGAWIHVRWPADSADWFAELEARTPQGTRLIRTSPNQVGGRPVSHGTLLVLSRDRDEIDWMMNLVRGCEAGATSAKSSR